MKNNNNIKSWVALMGISLASFLGCMDFTIVNTALPAMQQDLGVSLTALSWVINAFLLALTASMVVVGRLADMYGRRRLLYIGMALFALSSLGAGLASNIHNLILFRIIQGLAISILYTVPMAMIPSLFPAAQRGRATGLLVAVIGLGLALGPVVGGLIVSVLSWRYIFLVNLPVILLALSLCMTTLTESKLDSRKEKLDWFGLLLISLSLPLLIFTTIQAPTWGWLSFNTITLYITAIISLIGFYQVEKRTQSPLINFTLFMNRQFITGVIANFSLAFFYTLTFFLVPLFLHYMQHDTNGQVGLILLSATLMVALLSPQVGRMVDKQGPKLSLIIGFLLFSCSAVMQTTMSPHSHLHFIMLALILFGMGWACILGPSFVAALSSVPEKAGGVAMGSIGSLHNFGGACGLTLGTLIYYYQAKLTLYTRLAQQKAVTGAWLNQVIADPSHALARLQQHTQLNGMQINDVYQQSFMHGYHAAMWLLAGVSIAVMCIIAMGLRAKKNNWAHQES